MPDDPQLGNLPLGADPRIAQLSALIPHPATAQAGPASPLSPDLNQLLSQQSQLGMGAFGERERASMETAQRIQQIEQMMPELARATVIQPRFGPQRMTTDIHGQSIDREVPGTGGFMHNLGQALMAVGLATGPGQAVEGALKAGPRAEYGARVGQLERLREEQKATQEPMGAAAGLAYKPITAGAEVTKAEAAKTAAEARAESVKNRYQIQLQQVAQGWKRLDIDSARQQALQWYQQAYVEAYNARSQAGIAEAEIRAAAQRDVANVISESGVLKEFPWLSTLVPGIVPSAPQAPAGAQPVGGPKPLPKRPTAQAAPPSRPTGVPPDAKWDAKSRQWYK